MFKFVGTMAAGLALARLTGAADLSLNPRDSNFLKLRVGDTHYDTLGGFRGPLKMASELSQAFADEARGRKIPRGHDPLSVVSRYFRGNLAPVPGAAVDYLTGKDIAGRPFSVSREAWQRLAPIFVQAMREGWQDSGGRGALKALPAGLGVGTETYAPKEARSQSSTPISQAAPVPEQPETIRAQFNSAVDTQSPRVAVLVTPGERVPRVMTGFARIEVEGAGRLYVNRSKARAAGLTKPSE